MVWEENKLENYELVQERFKEKISNQKVLHLCWYERLKGETLKTSYRMTNTH